MSGKKKILFRCFQQQVHGTSMRHTRVNIFIITRTRARVTLNVTNGEFFFFFFDEIGTENAEHPRVLVCIINIISSLETEYCVSP